MKNLNGKVLLATLLISGVVAAVLGIAQIWFDVLSWDDFIKALVTIAIAGGLSGFLMAVDYDIEASREKFLLGAIVLLALTLSGLIVGQIWWDILSWTDFAKIFGTVFILFVLVSFVAAVREDFGTHKKLRNDKYLD